MNGSDKTKWYFKNHVVSLTIFILIRCCLWAVGKISHSLLCTLTDAVKIINYNSIILQSCGEIAEVLDVSEAFVLKLRSGGEFRDDFNKATTIYITHTTTPWLCVVNFLFRYSPASCSHLTPAAGSRRTSCDVILISNLFASHTVTPACPLARRRGSARGRRRCPEINAWRMSNHGANARWLLARTLYEPKFFCTFLLSKRLSPKGKDKI
jgi:hypothetical protein